MKDLFKGLLLLLIAGLLKGEVSAENVYLTNDPGDSLRIESSVLTRGCGIPEIIKNTIQSPAFFYDTCNKELFLFSGYSGKWKYYGSVADVVDLDTLRTPTSVVILNSSGTNATILAADTVLAGVIAAKDQKKVNRIYPFRDYDELRNADPTDTAVIYEDARGNRFRYDPSSALADDSAMVIVANGKRLVRIFEATLYLEWFGAKGDNVTDDADAFQKMFDYVARNNSLTCYNIGFINRNYLIGKTVNLPIRFRSADQFTAFTIEASGVGFTSGVDNGPMFQRVRSTMTEINNSLSDYFFVWNGGNFKRIPADSGSVAFKLYGMYGSTFTNMHFNGFDTAIVARFFLKSKFDNLFFNNVLSVGILGASLQGVIPGATVSSSAFNINHITNCRFFNRNGSFASLMLLGADQTVVDQIVSEGAAPTYNFYYDDQNNTGVLINTFRDIWIESNGGGNTSNFYLKMRGTMILDKIQRIFPDTIFVANMNSSSLLKIENMPYLGNIGSKPFKFVGVASGKNLYLGEFISDVFFDPERYDGEIPANRYGMTFRPANGGVEMYANRLLLKAGTNNADNNNRRISVEGSLEFIKDNQFDFGARTYTHPNAEIGRPRRALIGTGGVVVDTSSNTGFGFGNLNSNSNNNVAVAGWRYISPNITRFQGSQGGIDIPRGTTAERGAHYGGRLRWNTDSLTIEVNNGTAWQALATKNDIMNISTTTASKTLVAGIHETVLVNATGGNYTITLPAAAARGSYTIKKIDATANTVTLTGQSGATIDGNADHILTDQYSYITVVSDGANWFITGGN